MRPTFGCEYIENEFQRIADGLSDPLTVCLIGGGAMAVCDLVCSHLQEFAAASRDSRGLKAIQRENPRLSPLDEGDSALCDF